jgi:methionyl-tRNA formyltransferase
LPTKVKELSLEKNLNILQPEKLKNNTEFFEYLKSLDLDFIVVVAY